MKRFVLKIKTVIQLKKISDKKEVWKKPEKRVLVLFMPFIGDFLMYLDSINVLVEKYHKEGYLVDAAILRQNKSLVENYCAFDDILVFQQNEYVESKAYRNQLSSWMDEKKYEIAVNPYFDTLLDSDILAVLSKAPMRITADREKYYNDKIAYVRNIMNHLNKNAYQKRIVCTEKIMDFRKQAYFLKEMGCSFQAHVSYLKLLLEDYKAPTEHYCVMAPGASKTGKRWEPEKFAKVAEHITEQYGLEVFICGTPSEKAVAEEILSYVHAGKERVHNYMGQCNMTEYIELIRHADVVVTNDSAPVHIASSTGTRSVCIIGGWDYKRLIPYEVETDAPGTVLPDYVYSAKMPCFNCFDVHVANGNAQCAERIQNRMAYPCISSIPVSDVIDKLDSIMKEEEHIL